MSPVNERLSIAATALVAVVAMLSNVETVAALTEKAAPMDARSEETVGATTTEGEGERNDRELHSPYEAYYQYQPYLFEHTPKTYYEPATPKPTPPPTKATAYPPKYPPYDYGYGYDDCDDSGAYYPPTSGGGYGSYYPPQGGYYYTPRYSSGYSSGYNSGYGKKGSHGNDDGHGKKKKKGSYGSYYDYSTPSYPAGGAYGPSYPAGYGFGPARGVRCPKPAPKPTPTPAPVAPTPAPVAPTPSPMVIPSFSPSSMPSMSMLPSMMPSEGPTNSDNPEFCNAADPSSACNMPVDGDIECLYPSAVDLPGACPTPGPMGFKECCCKTNGQTQCQPNSGCPAGFGGPGAELNCSAP